MKSAMQVKALIRNLANENGLQPEIVLRNYMLERFLERVSLSEYRHQIILKGGMLIAALIGINARSTMDLDATLRGIDLTETELRKMINKILSVKIDDGVSMSLKKFESIRDEADYPGIRVTLDASLEKTKQTMKIDITTGDPITPKEIKYKYKLLLENRHIGIMTYNIESVLAEKIETILSRSAANTRLRDYYDVYILMSLFYGKINWEIFTVAYKNTAEKRGSYELLLEKGNENINSIKSSDSLLNLWKRYQQKNSYASDILWSDVLVNVERLYKKSLD